APAGGNSLRRRRLAGAREEHGAEGLPVRRRRPERTSVAGDREGGPAEGACRKVELELHAERAVAGAHRGATAARHQPGVVRGGPAGARGTPPAGAARQPRNGYGAPRKPPAPAVRPPIP